MTSRALTSCAFASLLLTALAGGCDELDEIELGRCGNGVLDPGEDCDGYPHPQGTPCAPAEEDNACRFVCDPACDRPDVDCEGEPSCPTGWGCGIDGVCRQPSGQFAARFEDLDVPAAPWIRAADLDNDGRDDLILVDYATARVAYTRGRGRPMESFAFSVTASGYPEIADVDRDGFRDLVVPTLEGLEVLRGTSRPELQPGIYPSLEIPPVTYRFANVDLAPPADPSATISGIGDEALAMLPSGFLRASFDELFGIAVDHPSAPENVVGPLATGQVDESSYAEEIVAAFAGESAVYVYHFAPDVGGDFEATLQPVALQEGVVRGPADTDLPREILAPGTELMGAQLVQANAAVPANGGASALCCVTDCSVLAPADDHLDIVVSTTEGLQTAYGLGDGTFHSDPCALGMAEPDGMAAATPPSVAVRDAPDCEPLLVDDFDGDGALDVVTRSGIWLTRAAPAGQTLCPEEASPSAESFSGWYQAAKGDFNGDGDLDFMALNLGLGDISFVLGSGEIALTQAIVSRPDATVMPRVGDFDGDGADDLAVVAPPNGLSPYAQELSVVWGERASVPRDVQSLGRVSTVLQIGVTSARPTGTAGVDDIDDLALLTRELELEGTAVQTNSPLARFGTLLGRADRRLSLPFKPTRPGETLSLTEAIYIPFGVAAGRLTFADAGEEALATVVRTPGVADPPGVLGIGLTSSGTTAAPPGTSAPVVEGSVSALDSPERGQRYLVTTADLGEGLEEAVIFEFIDGELGTRIHVPRYDGGSWDVPPSADLPVVPVGAVVNVEDPASISLANFSPFIPSGVMSCDLGAPDGEHVLIMMVEDEPGEYLNVKDQFFIDVEKRFAVYAFSPEDLRAIRQGAASVSPQVVVAEESVITGFACLDVNGDGRNEIVTSAAQLLFNASAENEVVGGSGFRVQIAWTAFVPPGEPGGPGLGPLTPLVDFDEDAIAELQSEDITGVPLQGMVSGDVDGDGIEDLVFGAFDTTLVLYGEAKNP